MNAGSAIFRAIADFTQVRREARRTSSDLDALGMAGNKNVKIFSGVARGFGAMGGGLMGMVRSLAIALPLLGAMSALLIAGAGHTLALAQSLVPLVGLGTLLPGLWAGMAIGAGTFALAMKDAKKQLGDLLPAMQSLQKTASQAFWDKANKPIHDLTAQLLPQLKAGLSAVGGQLGGMTADFAGAVGKFTAGGILEMIFIRTAKAIQIARQAVSPLVEAFTTLTYFGSAYLPRLAAFFVDLSKKFNDFIQGADSNGQLAQWAEGGITVLKQLWSVVTSVLSIVGSLMKAASNAQAGDALVGMAAGLKMVADVLARPEVQAGMTAMFASASAALGPLGDGLQKLGTALGTLGPALSAIVGTGTAILGQVVGYIGEILGQPAVNDGIVTFMGKLQEAFSKLEPAMKPLGELIGALLPFLGELAVAAGSVLGPAIAIIAPILTDIFKTLTPIIPLLIGLAAAITLVVFALNLSWIGLIIIAIVALVAGISWLVQNWDGVVNTVTVIWGGFLNWMKEVIDGFVVWWNGVWGGFGNWLGEVWGGMVNWITEIWDGFVSWITSVIDGFVVWWLSVWEPFAAFFMGIWTGLIAFLAPVIAVFVAMFNAFGAIFTFIGALIGFVINWIILLFQVWWANTVATMTGIWTAITTVWNTIMGFIMGVLTAIWGFIVAVWSTVVGYISGAMAAIWGVISGIWNTVVGFIGGALARIWGTISSVWNMVLGFIGGVMAGIWSAIVNKWNEIVGWLGGIGGRIMGAIGNLGSLLWNAGTSIIQGLLDGLKSMWDSVAGFFQNLTASIPSWKGPAPVDKKLLTNAGELIMGGFKDALESKYGGIKKSLQSFTTDLNKNAEIGLTGNFSGGLDPSAAMRFDQSAYAPGDFAGGSSATLTAAPAKTAGDTTLIVNNPKPERATDSLPRAVRRLGYVGVGGNA